MDYAGYSDAGGRSNNEDALLTLEQGGCYLFAVADGLGGVDAGEVASQTAKEALRDGFSADPAGFDLRAAVVDANDKILQLQAQTNKKMKTTAAAVYFTPDEAVCVHLGDSRVYLFGKNGILYQSTDHSASQMAVYAGEITAAEIRGHEDRNLLTRALGASESPKPERAAFPRGEVQAALVCSDGFWEYVTEQEMLFTLRTEPNAPSWLQAMRALLARRVDGKHDNNTAVAVIL